MIIFCAALFSLLTAHQPSEENPIPNLGSGSNSGLYINYDTSTLDLDGIFEFQANNGLFFELWGNSQINSNISLNTSVGIIKKINSRLITVGGYSNYIDNNLINHEVFFGQVLNNKVVFKNVLCTHKSNICIDLVSQRFVCQT